MTVAGEEFFDLSSDRPDVANARPVIDTFEFYKACGWHPRGDIRRPAMTDITERYDVRTTPDD